MDTHDLNIKHPEYERRSHVWDEVYYFNAPHEAMQNRERWIKKRPFEDEELYRDRLNRFAYTPVLSDAIWDLLKLMATGNIDTNPDLPQSKNLWLRMARSMMVYGVLWTSLVGDDAVVMNPTSILNWGYGSDGELDFVVVRTYSESTQLFEKPKRLTHWDVIERSRIRRWTAEDNHSPELVSDSTNEVGRVFFQMSTVPNEYWVAALCMIKQIQYVVVESCGYDAATLMYIQRTFKPIQTPDGDLDNTYLGDGEPDIETDNRTVVKGDFAFVEPSGSSIVQTREYQSNLERQIKDIVSRGTFNVSQNANQSAQSKSFDYANVSNHVLRYASLVNETFTQHLSSLYGIPYEMTGMQDFQINRLQSVIDVSTNLMPLAEQIPEESLSRWFQYVGSVLDNSNRLT